MTLPIFAWAAALALPALGTGGPIAAPEVPLSAAAAASGRPPECSSSSRRGRGPSVWARARVPALGPYCDWLARSQAQLTTDPAMARRAAEKADELLGGKARPLVLLGRAELALDRPAAAVEHFDKAAALDARSMEDPPSMRDRASALRRVGRFDEALVVYRALVPRAGLLASEHEHARVLLEAAFVSIAAAPDASPQHLDEAFAFVAEVRRGPPTALSADAAYAYALLLDRAGKGPQAEGVLAEAKRRGLPPIEGEVAYVGDPAERFAVAAISLEHHDRAAARRAWGEYLAQAGASRWAEAARRRMARLGEG